MAKSWKHLGQQQKRTKKKKKERKRRRKQRKQWVGPLHDYYYIDTWRISIILKTNIIAQKFVCFHCFKSALKQTTSVAETCSFSLVKICTETKDFTAAGISKTANRIASVAEIRTLFTGLN